MKSLAISLAIFLSASSFSTTTILLEEDDYSLEVTLTAKDGNLLSGSVHAPKAQEGNCKGSYNIDSTFEMLNIAFTQGDRGCHNESLEIDLSMQQLEELLSGQQINVIYRSNMYFAQPRSATLRVTATDRTE